MPSLFQLLRLPDLIGVPCGVRAHEDDPLVGVEHAERGVWRRHSAKREAIASGEYVDQCAARGQELIPNPFGVSLDRLGRRASLVAARAIDHARDESIGQERRAIRLRRQRSRLFNQRRKPLRDPLVDDCQVFDDLRGRPPRRIGAYVAPIRRHGFIGLAQTLGLAIDVGQQFGDARMHVTQNSDCVWNRAAPSLLSRTHNP